MLTKLQLQSIHIFRRKLETLSAGHFARSSFDLLLINLGDVAADADGAVSSKLLTNSGFERVMTFLEEAIAHFDKTIGTYWRDRDARRGRFLSARQEWEIKQLVGELATLGVIYAADGLARRLSNHRVGRVEDLSPAEASAVIEMLKAAIARAPKEAAQ